MERSTPHFAVSVSLWCPQETVLPTLPPRVLQDAAVSGGRISQGPPGKHSGLGMPAPSERSVQMLPDGLLFQDVILTAQLHLNVTIGTPFRLTPTTINYTWWVVYVLSSAATRGGAISADSQHCALHQPSTCYSLPLSYLFRPMLSFSVGTSFVVCLALFVVISSLLSAFCVQDPQARSS